MTLSNTAEREATEVEEGTQAPASAPAETNEDVKLSASEKDAVVRTTAQEEGKSTVDAPGSRAGESRAWDAQRRVD